MNPRLEIGTAAADAALLSAYNIAMDLANTYIPADRRRALAAGQALPARAHGTVLFTDIAGFTPLTETLAQRFGPNRGAELLTRSLNEVYQAIIDPVDRHGGSVIGFSGDAITCWFDAEGQEGGPDAGDPAGAARRAAAAAVAMQQAMPRFARYNVAPGATASLAIKTALASGTVRRFLVGDPTIQVIDVLAGAPLERMAAAEHVAEQGELVCDEESAMLLDGLVSVTTWRRSNGRAVAVLEPGPELQAGLPATMVAAPALLSGTAVQQWLLPGVWSRLRSGEERFLAELRPATALFLRFTGLDFELDDAAGARLDAYIHWVQRIIERYEASLIQLTTGDKGSYLYAAFGAPIAHDDDTERAVAAALELRRPPAELSYITGVQIGISQGMMRTGAYGSSGRHTYGVLGDETNMAARLMAEAGNGQIVLSQRAAELVGERYMLEALGSRRLKGKSTPQAIYAVVGARSPTLDYLAALYAGAPAGRDHELSQLSALLERVLAGQGQVARLEGEAGTGKSHLAVHFARQAAGRGLTVFLGACQSAGQEAYAALREPVRMLLGLDQGSIRASDQAAAVEQALLAIDPDWAVRAPLLGDLLGLPIPDNATTAALDARLRQEALANLVVELVQHRAWRQPLLLMLEDVHWLDEAAQGIVLALARLITEAPVLLLLLHRPPQREQETFFSQLADLPDQTQLVLGELDQAGAAALITDRLRGAVDPLAQAVIYTQTQGNPFFIEELVDALRESGRLEQNEHGWALARPVMQALREAKLLERSESGWQLKGTAPLTEVELGLPETVHGMVLSRLDRLPDDAKLTLKVASVIGRTFEHDLLAAAHPLAPPASLLESHFEIFQLRDFARIEAQLPQVIYIFKHNITQEAVYHTLLESQQQELHLAVAHALERQQPQAIERLAYHFGHSDLVQPDTRARAITYLDASAWRAKRDFANETALAYFERALALEARWTWLKGKVEVLHILGRRLQEEATLLILEQIGEDRAEIQLEVARLWSEYYEAVGDYDQAQYWLDQAKKLASEFNDVRSTGRCYARAGLIAWRQGDYGAAARAYDTALAIVQGQHDLQDVESEARYGLGLVKRQQGQFDDARRLFEADLATNRQLGNRQHEARALNALGAVANLQRHFSQAAAYFRAALEIREIIGDRAGVGTSLMSMAQTFGYLGDYSQVEGLLLQARQIQQGLRNRWEEMLVLNELGILYTAVGAYDRALAHLERGLELSRQMGSEIGEAYLRCNLGQAQRDSGALAAACSTLSDGLALARAQGDVNLEAIYLGDLALAELHAGAVQLAATHAADSLALFTMLEEPMSTTSVLATLATAQWLSDEARDAARSVQRCLEILDGCGGQGPDFPQRDYFMCGQVLDALGEPDTARHAYMCAHQLLNERAERISDGSMRRSYLENVALHREIAARIRRLEAESDS
ncbi:MAG: tetratricopeptide repeat protein [Caldilineaceae bacterium]|nr:tetratricopeptide repeat protein [Caldilineaceae bacterium]